MRIIHINFSFTSGGIDTMIVDIINYQIKYCKVELLIINDLINYEILKNIDDKVKIRLLKRPPGSKNPWYIFKLNQIIKNSNPDFIHCHNNKLPNLLFIRVKKGLTIHLLGSSLKNLDKFDQLFSISEAVKTDLKARGNIDSIVVHNGIDFKLLKKSTKSPNNLFFRIIQISRLDHTNKGQHILIKGLDIIINKFGINDITINFVGEGHSYDYLYSLTNELHLEDHITFLGNQSRKFIYENLPTYDLLIQPSINEGFGLTILEGIGSVIPVLASDSNGPAEISKILNYNFLFETGNPEKLAEAILNVYQKRNDSNYFNELELYSQKAKDYFSIEQTAMNYIKAYKELISQN